MLKSLHASPCLFVHTHTHTHPHTHTQRSGQSRTGKTSEWDLKRNETTAEVPGSRSESDLLWYLSQWYWLLSFHYLPWNDLRTNQCTLLMAAYVQTDRTHWHKLQCSCWRFSVFLTLSSWVSVNSLAACQTCHTCMEWILPLCECVYVCLLSTCIKSGVHFCPAHSSQSLG